MKRFKVFLDVTTSHSVIVDVVDEEAAQLAAIDNFDNELCEFEEQKKIEVTDVQRIE